MKQREREIGIRLKEFRESLGWSQVMFARQIGVSRDQLARVEYGHSPLRYEIAWRIRHVFSLSLDWLWGGDAFPDDLSADSELPQPDAVELAENALLTEVFVRVYGPAPDPEESRIRAGRPVHSPKATPVEKREIRHRAFIRMFLQMQVDLMLPRVPDGRVKDFGDIIYQAMVSYLRQFPPEPDERVDARFDALLWERMRAEVARKLIGQKSYLTDTATSLKLPGSMKAQLPSLRERLNRATKETGKMSALADFLGKAIGHKVPLASVSRWLSGKREPGGEITLLMLRWVEQQERQK